MADGVPVSGEDNVESSFAIVDALETELKTSPYLRRVEAHIEDPVKLAEAVLRHAVLFLDAEGLISLQERLSDGGLEARAADIRAALDTPQGMVAKEFALRDPLGLPAGAVRGLWCSRPRRGGAIERCE